MKQYRRGAGRESKSVQLVVQPVGSGRIKQFSYVRLWHLADVVGDVEMSAFRGKADTPEFAR